MLLRIESGECVVVVKAGKITVAKVAAPIHTVLRTIFACTFGLSSIKYECNVLHNFAHLIYATISYTMMLC